MRALHAFFIALFLIVSSIAVVTTMRHGPMSVPFGSAGSDTASQVVSTGNASVEMKDAAFLPAELTVPVGTTVTWTNRDPFSHTVTTVDPKLWGTTGSGSSSDAWLKTGQTWSFTFGRTGDYVYYCIPHASLSDSGAPSGMVGTIHVTNAVPPVAVATNFVRPSPVAPAALRPGPDGIVHVMLETQEVTGRLADGVSYDYWTFNGTVPGPMIRVHEGDTVEVMLHNAANSTHAHSIDLHAVTGPGGGAKSTQTPPGATTSFRFKALAPGLFVYHCATPHIPTHVANGMFGLILVEPKGGLPHADREYYVVESEWYTGTALGVRGPAGFSAPKMMAEAPEYFTFNGAVGAVTGDGALQAKVGDSVRLFFGVGGGVPSSFHVIGEIFDNVSMDGNEAATHNRQTVLVPAAGAAIVDLVTDYPGDYLLVDHTLTRAIDRGAVGILHVEGTADPAVFSGATTPGSGH